MLLPTITVTGAENKTPIVVAIGAIEILQRVI